jgi:hypothetical protein
MGEVHDQVRKLVEAAAKLLHETERLRRDVATLHGRVEPFEGEVPLPQPPGYAEPPKAKWNVVDALNMIQRARNDVLGCEHVLSAIRARMDTIESDALSREEMKPWLKSRDKP